VAALAPTPPFAMSIRLGGLASGSSYGWRSLCASVLAAVTGRHADRCRKPGGQETQGLVCKSEPCVGSVGHIIHSPLAGH